MAHTMHEAVREACLWLAEAEEFVSHGSPNFRVRGKTFATFVVNHHGDGRVALWLNASPGLQELHVSEEPQEFFVPPYVGHRGWLGVRLDLGLGWERIASLVREAYEKVAPADLRARLGPTPKLAPPEKMSVSDVDPLKSPRALAAIKRLRALCSKLPEAREQAQFGHPAWQAGKRTFAIVRQQDARLTFCFWVGVDQQGLLTADSRYTIPPYFGHNGWISLDVTDPCDWTEVTGLMMQSYRHFALKRMLAQLPPHP